MRIVLAAGLMTAANIAAAQQTVTVESHTLSESEQENVERVVRAEMTGPYLDATTTEFSTLVAQKIGQIVHVCGFVRGKGLLSTVPFYVIVREDLAAGPGVMAGLGNDFHNAWFVRDECALLNMVLPPSEENPGPPRAWEGDTPPEPLPEREPDSPEIVFPDAQPAVEATVATPVDVPSAWLLQTEESAFTDQTNVYVSALSLEYASCPGGTRSFPELVFRCEENATEMYIAHGCYTPTITSDTWPVDIRVGDQPMRTVQMGGSASNEALGFWNYQSARSFAEELFGAERLLVRFRDYSGNETSLTFPVANLESSIRPLREACGW